MKKVIAIVFTLLVIGLISAYFALAETGFQGSAFAAKNLCSGVFVSKLPAETVFEQAVVPASPPLTLASYAIDEEDQSVSTSLLGLYHRKAQFRQQLGCTLVPGNLSSLAPVELSIPSLSEQSIGNASVTTDASIDYQAFDYQALSAALDYAFAENDPNGNKNTKAVVVMHEGRIIAERYAQGVNLETPLLGWSMTKSVTNMLVGILVREGQLDIEQAAPVAEWQNDERQAITINHLLHMSSGLEFNETYGMNTDVTQMLTAETDAGAYAASKPLIHSPGEFWDYSSGTTNILARIIQQKVGGTLPAMYAFVRRELFNPLDIHSAYFEPDPSGVLVGSSFLYMSARDWAKLGQLMLNQGTWRGQQIFTEQWAEYSVTPAVTNKRNEYGAHYWLNLDPDDSSKQRTWPDVPSDAFSMNGYQGQHVVIIPSQQLVVARLGFTPRPTRPGMNAILSQIITAVSSN